MSKWDMTNEEKINQDLYIVYEICSNGSLYMYSKNYGVDYIFTTKQLKGVLAHLKKRSIKYEVHKVKLQDLGKVEI